VRQRLWHFETVAGHKMGTVIGAGIYMCTLLHNRQTQRLAGVCFLVHQRSDLRDT